MANRLKVQEQEAILNLKRRGWKIRRIARELRISRNTVRGYLRSAASTSLDKAAVCAGEPRQFKLTHFRPSAPPSRQTKLTHFRPPGNQGRQSLCDELGPQIREKFQAGLTAQRIYQDLKAQVAFPGSYESVKRYVAKPHQADPSVVEPIEV